MLEFYNPYLTENMISIFEIVKSKQFSQFLSGLSKMQQLEFPQMTIQNQQIVIGSHTWVTVGDQSWLQGFRDNEKKQMWVTDKWIF